MVLTIPDTVTYIYATAFAYCESAAEYHMMADTPPTLEREGKWDEYFPGIPSDCIIYVPAASLDAYKTATGWSDVADHIQAEA